MAEFAKLNCKHCIRFFKLSIFFIRNVHNYVLILSFVVFLKKNPIESLKSTPLPFALSIDSLHFPFITIFAGLSVNLSENG